MAQLIAILEGSLKILDLTRIQNLFPSTNAYKWFRFTAFDELITDTFYNDEVKGRRG